VHKDASIERRSSEFDLRAMVRFMKSSDEAHRIDDECLDPKCARPEHRAAPARAGILRHAPARGGTRAPRTRPRRNPRAGHPPSDEICPRSPTEVRLSPTIR
jgi:hypothetical protein